MGPSKSLKAQIGHDVFRLFCAYILGVTSLSMLLAIYGIFFYQQANFNHYKALITTRLGAELPASFRQADDLSQATEVWTGMIDSVGKGSYVLPMLEKANQNPYCKYELLDYLGRFFMGRGNTTGLLEDSLENIQKTLVDSELHLELVNAGETDYLVASVPVTADFTDSIIGMVLLYVDLDKILATLDFPDDLKIKYSLSPFDETAADFSKHSETFVFKWREVISCKINF